MADTMLSFSDNNLSTNFLSMDDLRKACPAAFKTTPTNPGVSERYVHANTATVIEDLAKLGWYPVQAKQCRPKKGSKGIRSFHMIALQNPDVKICKPVTDITGETTEIVDSYPRIILTNSHDGFNSFKFMVGLFRLVCSNGLILCSDEMVNMSIRHINYSFEALRTVVSSAIEQIPYIVNTMNTMKNTKLSEAEKKELASAVVKIRKDVEDDEKFSIDEATVMDILMPVLNGYEATKTIRNLKGICSEVPIIAMTANAFEEDKLKAIASGMDGHVQKPLEKDTLVKAIYDVLGM